MENNKNQNHTELIWDGKFKKSIKLPQRKNKEIQKRRN